MRSVVKHSYIRGSNQTAKRSAKAHVNYILYRSGDEERKHGKARQFFSADRDHVQGREVKQKIDKVRKGKVTVHKMILSPGLQKVDMKAYTRFVLKEIGRQKGLDLDWEAVAHDNTSHSHVHAVIHNNDKNGREVTFRKHDYEKLRELGDRYLERNHFFERFMHSDVDRAIEHFEYDKGDRLFESLMQDMRGQKPPDKSLDSRRRPEWDKDKAIAHLPKTQKIEIGDKTYTKYSSLDELSDLVERLEAGNEGRLPKAEFRMLHSWIGTKEKRGDDFFEDEAKTKWDKTKEPKERILDAQLQQPKYGPGAGPERSRPKGREQRLHEIRGRLWDDHERFNYMKNVERCKEMSERFPARKEEFDKEIKELKEAYYETIRGIDPLAKSRDFPTVGKGRIQREFETKGRNSDSHARYQYNQDLKHYNDLKEMFPDRREEFDRQLSELKASHFEGREVPSSQDWKEFDDLVSNSDHKDYLLTRDEPETKSVDVLDSALQTEPDHTDSEHTDTEHTGTDHTETDRGDSDHGDSESASSEDSSLSDTTDSKEPELESQETSTLDNELEDDERDREDDERDR